jgi:hypothetical protein
LTSLGGMLEKHAGLDRKSVERLQAGQVVSRLLRSHAQAEVAVLGAAVIAVPGAYFMSQFRDIRNFERGPDVLHVGKLGMPPAVSDISKLTLIPADIEALKKCKPDSCALKLSLPMIEQISHGMNGRNPSYAGIDSLFRAALIDYVGRYAAGGKQALICYADKTPRICVAKVSSELLSEFTLLQDYAPEFAEYLAASGQNAATNIDGFLYWSEEKFGPLKPVSTATHVATYSNEREGVRWNFIASQQIYASHYFRASLGLTVLVDLGGDRILMLYLNRSRVDGLNGWLGGMKRALVGHKLKNGMQQHVAELRKKLELSYRQRP